MSRIIRYAVIKKALTHLEKQLQIYIFLCKMIGNNPRFVRCNYFEAVTLVRCAEALCNKNENCADISSFRFRFRLILYMENHTLVHRRC